MKIRKTIALSTILSFSLSLPVLAAVGTGWSYTGETGPDYWSTLSAEYSTCADGIHQSPIDISASIDANLPTIQYKYRTLPLSIENNGHTVEVHYHMEGQITIDGSEYELLQFHFHSPSEHTEDGSPAAMEIHFVHINADSQLAVIGALIDAGDANAVFERIISNAPMSKGIIHVDGESINASNLLPTNPANYTTYSGSLTTPPCSEGVRWFLLDERIEFSQDQINQFLDIIGENARPTQPLFGRELLERD